jgi:hypothetical protein
VINERKMKTVTLHFPTTNAMAEYIIVEKISGVEVKTVELTLKGALTDQQIAIACTQYGADLLPLRRFVSEWEVRMNTR